jgi:hypothetical protein
MIDESQMLCSALHNYLSSTTAVVTFKRANSRNFPEPKDKLLLRKLTQLAQLGHFVRIQSLVTCTYPLMLVQSYCAVLSIVLLTVV